MIRRIINDLATDTISLSKALTMSKIIASDIGSASFKSWIKNELEGYSNKNELPDYRQLPCNLVAKEYYLSGYHDRPVDAHAFDKKLQQQCGYSLYTMYIVQSVSTIESMISGRNDGEINCNVPPFVLESLKENSYDSCDIYNIVQVAHVSQARNIVVQVKNKLLDTLLELNEQFPTMASGIFENSKNKKKAESIVNINIYGGSPNINSAVGNNNTQNVSVNSLADEVYQKLLSMGIPETDAQEAKEIVETKGSATFKNRILSWAGNMANKAVEAGIKFEVANLLTYIGTII